MPSSNGIRARAATAARDPRRLLSDPRGVAVLLGGLVGVLAVPSLVAVRGWLPRTASNTSFALGALVLGFAVLSWSAAVTLGPAVENLQDYMDLDAGWTESGARQAFSVLTAFGAGTMLGSVLGTLLVRALA